MARSSEWRGFEGIVTTTHLVETAYGEIKLSKQIMLDVAERMNNGTLPMNGLHDASKRLTTRNVVALVRLRPDNEWEVAVSGEVQASQYEALGPISGFSFSGSVPLGKAYWTPVENADLSVSADGAWFDRNDIALAGSILNRVGHADAEQHLQFAAVPDALIVLSASAPFLETISLGILSAALWDAIKHLWTRRRIPKGGYEDSTTHIHLIFDKANGDRLSLWVDTNEIEIAKEAIQSLPTRLGPLMEHRGPEVLAWNPSQEPDAGGWVVPS